ncbi:MAG: tRNA lysidine(34) synthetase TilS [Candidatus Moranbacteria bacterium]|jgi:tRNA(Ile)-lysidine synthase|nr:tRNA lysidine(34) synthetase TilS [Candidatus Moranbacteria bacterium]MDX9855600.1 tRNA lysidine(34) synthetase TilS [Candidatus Moranbacteria bacterium]
MNSFIKKIQSFSKRFDLWEKGSKIIVGVSGGPDSVCLLDILTMLKKRNNFEILIAHVNYGLRGGDSDKDEIFVKKLAQKYGLELEILNAEKESGKNPTENFLRDIRYDFFEKLRRKNNFDLIAVAHNMDDQAETVLMRLIRGSGLQGLGSIRPKNNCIIRPLINISREEIIGYLKKNNLRYRTDKTNKENKFLRNKVRNKLIPYLEKNYNPSIKKTLAGLAESVSDDYHFISRSADKAGEKIVSKKKYSVEMSVREILKLHHSLQRQVIRNSILKIRESLADVESRHIEEILKIARSHKGKRQKTRFGNLKVARKGDKINIVVQKNNGTI